MAYVDPNPSDIWDAYLRTFVEKMSDAQLEELGELMSQPVITWYLWIDEETGEVHYA